MVKYYNGLNGIKVEKRDIDSLLKKYSVKDIETSLIKIFLEDNNLSTKSELLLKIIKKNHEKIKKKIKQHLEERKINLDLKTLERFFELLIEPRDRKLNGSFYTPSFIVDYIINESISNNESVCDLSCGSGAFLVGATQRINKITKRPIIKIIEENIFGGDISKTSVHRSKIILSLLALINREDKKQIKFNLREGDSLSHNWKKDYPNGFDVVIGNPPYVRAKNLSKEIREKIHEKYYTATIGNSDLYIPFIELGIKILKEKGVLGYIIPNGYFNGLNAKKLRELLQQNKYIKKILDFNHLKVFNDVAIYTTVTFIDKKLKEKFDYCLVEDKRVFSSLDKLKFSKIKFSQLESDKWNLLTEKDYENIKKIEKGVISLKEHRINTGIATLRNELYLVNERKKKGNFYLKEFEGKEFLIEKGATKEIVMANVVRNEKNIRDNTFRIIFPYYIKENKAKIIEESELKSRYPLTYKYLTSIKGELKNRDKGKKRYETWYAYGRTQGLTRVKGSTLLTPFLNNKSTFVKFSKDALFMGGYIVYPKGDIEVLKKILNSKVMWYYMKKTSKDYSSGYKSFTKTFMQGFSIPKFTEKEKAYLKKESNENKINKFLTKKYDVDLSYI